MSDSDTTKETLKAAPAKLSLTKTVESGQVRQNFTRGRSKTVTVEVRKTRTFSKDGGRMVEVRGQPNAGGRGNLTANEHETRLEALRRAEVHAQVRDRGAHEPDVPAVATREAEEVLFRRVLHGLYGLAAVRGLVPRQREAAREAVDAFARAEHLVYSVDRAWGEDAEVLDVVAPERSGFM